MGLFGIFAYIFQMYIRPQDWLFFMYGFPVVVVIGSILLIIAFFGLPQQNRPIMLPQVTLVILYLLMIILSNILAGHASDAIAQFILYLKRAAIFFILLLIVNNSEQLKKIIVLIVVMNVVLAIQAIAQSNFGIMVPGQKLLQETRVAWVGAWDGPNITCMLFITAIALSLGFFSSSYSAGWKALNVLFISIMTYAAYLTNSRSGFLALLAIAACFLWGKFVKNKSFFIRILAIAIIFIIMAGALKLGPSRMAELDSSESSAHERTWLWESALNMFEEHRISGVGKGQYRVDIYTSAHNNFAQNMAEMGFVGLFLYIGLMYLSIKGVCAIKTLDPEKIGNAKLVSLSNALFMCIIGFNVATFFITADLDILFAWIGLCAVAINIARKEIEDFSFKFSFKDMAIVSALSVMMIFVIWLIAVKEII